MKSPYKKTLENQEQITTLDESVFCCRDDEQEIIRKPRVLLSESIANIKTSKSSSIQPTHKEGHLEVKQNNSDPLYELELKKLELRILENTLLLKQLDKESNIPIVEKIEDKKEDIVEEKIKEEILDRKDPVVQKKGFFKRMFTSDSQNKHVNLLNTSFHADSNLVYSDDINLNEDDYTLIKRCPLCNKKIKKSKVFLRKNSNVQVLKCKNKYCSFTKEIIIPKDLR